MEGNNFQSPTIQAITAPKNRRESIDKHNGEMYDLILPKNGAARTTKSYLHSRLAYKMAPTRKNTQPPPQIKRIPAKFDYLYRYNFEPAYTPIRAGSGNNKSYKERFYTALLTSIRASAGSPEMGIQKLWSNTDWTRIRKNLKDVPGSDNTRCIWYQVLHDLIPTDVRLHRIKMTPSNSYQRCTMADILEHRLTECGEGRRKWQYTKTRIALILRTTPSRKPDEWILRPQCG